MGYRIRHLRESCVYRFRVERRCLFWWVHHNAYQTEAEAVAVVADLERPRIIWRTGQPMLTPQSEPRP